MKALSIQQPYAWLIVNGHKDVENRTWEQPRWVKLPMRIVVHAGKKMHEGGASRGGILAPDIRGLITPDIEAAWDRAILAASPSILGALVGEVTITAWTDAWAAGSPWFEGPYGLILSDPLAYKTPVPYSGQLGLFDVPDDAVARGRV